MTGKIKIKFLESRVVQDGREGTPQETRFEEGKVYSLEPESADRWVRRKVAEFVGPKARAKSANKSADDNDDKPDADSEVKAAAPAADTSLDDLMGGEQSGDANSEG